MPNTIKPLGLGIASRRVLSDVVTDDLRQAIVDHELEPGRRISEDELAAQMGVSRGPIREALARLEREGLITLERHRGARVASWSEQDIDEIYSTRYSKLTDKQRTPKEVSKIDLDFHSALFAAAHHERLFKAWEVLRSQIHAFLVYTWSQDDKVNKEFLPKWGPDHLELLEIIRTKQVTKAKAVIHEHVERGAKRVAKHFKESPSVNVPKKKR